MVVQEICLQPISTKLVKKHNCQSHMFPIIVCCIFEMFQILLLNLFVPTELVEGSEALGQCLQGHVLGHDCTCFLNKHSSRDQLKVKRIAYKNYQRFLNSSLNRGACKQS